MCRCYYCKSHMNYTGYVYTKCGRGIGRGPFKSIILAFIRRTEEIDKPSLGHSKWIKNLESPEFEE
jgi:hypothetical protein